MSLAHLQSLGVSYWHLPTTPEQAIANPTSGALGDIRTSRQYKNHDVIQVTPAKLPNYNDKIRAFFQEHLHEDEEIRYVLDGCGYFDVRRDRDDKWVRVEMTAGDMIVLPAGCYHRYTNDLRDFVHVMRLFKDNPKWSSPHSHIHTHALMHTRAVLISPHPDRPHCSLTLHSPLPSLSLCLC